MGSLYLFGLGGISVGRRADGQRSALDVFSQKAESSLFNTFGTNHDEHSLPDTGIALLVLAV